MLSTSSKSFLLPRWCITPRQQDIMWLTEPSWKNSKWVVNGFCNNDVGFWFCQKSNPGQLFTACYSLSPAHPPPISPPSQTQTKMSKGVKWGSSPAVPPQQDHISSFLSCPSLQNNILKKSARSWRHLIRSCPFHSHFCCWLPILTVPTCKWEQWETVTWITAQQESQQE